MEYFFALSWVCILGTCNILSHGAKKITTVNKKRLIKMTVSFNVISQGSCIAVISILKAPTCILKSNYLKCLQTVVIGILLAVTKAGGEYCRLLLKVAGEDTQEATPSLLDGIFALNRKK